MKKIDLSVELVPSQSAVSGFKPRFHPIVAVKDLVQTYCNIENPIVEALRTSFEEEEDCYTESYVVRYYDPESPTTIFNKYPSHIQKFYNLRIIEAPYHVWSSKPMPVLLFGTTAGRNVVLNSKYGEVTVASGEGVTKVTNLVPNTEYTWAETSSNVGGSFITKGQVRFIDIGLYNFRDIGGWPCYDDDGRIIGRIEYGKCYRGMGICYQKGLDDLYKGGSWNAFLCDKYPEIYRTLVDIGVTDDIDLRGWDGHGNEKAASEDSAYHGDGNFSHAIDPGYPIEDGTRKITYRQGEIRSYDWNPINKQSGAYTDTNSKSTSFDYDYHNNGSSTSAKGGSKGTQSLKRYVWENLFSHLEIIAEEGRVPYVHCATGADRTGVIVAMVMALCGCSLNDIVKEYEYTSLNDVGSQTVNIGWIRASDGKVYGTNVSGSKHTNIRTFLASFYKTSELNDASDVTGSGYFWKNDNGGTLGRETVRRITAWLKHIYMLAPALSGTTQHTEADWNAFVSRLRTKMIVPA